MTPRERVISAVTFGTPDRAPLRHNVTGSAVIKHGPALLDILSRYPDDFGTDTSYSDLMRQREEMGEVLEEDLRNVLYLKVDVGIAAVSAQPENMAFLISCRL